MTTIPPHPGLSGLAAREATTSAEVAVLGAGLAADSSLSLGAMEIPTSSATACASPPTSPTTNSSPP